MNRRDRAATAIGVGIALYLVATGTAGYFIGMDGIGRGWPAFFAVVAISSATLAACITIGFIIYLIALWIYRGSD